MTGTLVTILYTYLQLTPAWLKQVVSGFFNYHTVPTHSAALSAFRHHMTDFWLRTLRRRSQNDRMTWERLGRLAGEAAETPHPSPLAEPAVCRQTPEVGAVCGNPARTELCGARAVMGVPTTNPEPTPICFALFIGLRSDIGSEVFQSIEITNRISL